jgi:putrescine transport system ATP-binding protein
MTVAGRIGVMDAGRLDQVASPRELYEAPISRWIAEFIGDVNLFDGQVESRDQNHLTVATRDAGPLVVAEPRQEVTKTIVSIAIRPEKVKLSRRAPVSDARNARPINWLEGVVTDISYLGGLTTYKVRLDSGAVVRSSMANTARIEIDAYSVSQRVVAWFSPDDCMVLEQ